MLMPKKVKHRKQHRGRTTGSAKGATTVSYGDYGIQVLEPGWLTSRQIEAVLYGRSIKEIRGRTRLLFALGENAAERDAVPTRKKRW